MKNRSCADKGIDDKRSDPRIEHTGVSPSVQHHNYHPEHHPWPAIPWHQLPAAPERVVAHLDNKAGSYWQLQLDVLRQRNLPNGSPGM